MITEIVKSFKQLLSFYFEIVEKQKKGQEGREVIEHTLIPPYDYTTGSLTLLVQDKVLINRPLDKVAYSLQIFIRTSAVNDKPQVRF